MEYRKLPNGTIEATDVIILSRVEMQKKVDSLVEAKQRRADEILKLQDANIATQNQIDFFTTLL